MNKRIICLILTAVMTLGIFFTNIPVAQAANATTERLTISQAAVDLLKEYEGFRGKPYYDVYHWSIGYGTRCPDNKVAYYKANPMSKEEAEKKLREYTTMFENSVYKFADKKGITLNQQQLDALVMFSYNCGSAWTTEKTGVFHNAIANGATGNELISAFCIWSATSSGGRSTGKLKRRRCEANLYLNGVYSRTVPSNYCYTLFDLNGGKSDSYLVQGYDSNLTAEITAVTTYEGYTFDGWYTAAKGGQKVTVLDADTNGKTLYAHWVANDGSTPPAEVWGIEVTVTGEGAVLRKGPGATYDVKDGTVNLDDMLFIEETAPVGGVLWGRYGDTWLDLSHTNYQAIIDSMKEPVLYKGTVKVDSSLNVRSGPGTGYSKVASLKNGTIVEVFEEKTSGSTLWGRIEQGWVSLKYVKVLEQEPETVEPELPDENAPEPEIPPAGPDVDLPEQTEPEVTEPEVTEPEETEPEVTEPEVTEPEETEPEVTEPEETEPEETEPTEPVRTGTVKTGGDRLRVRKGASTSSSIVGYLQNKQKVTVSEQKTVGSTTWGKVEKGWVSMAYIVLDPLPQPEPDQKPDTTPDTTPDTDKTPEQTQPQGLTGKIKTSGDKLRIRKSASTSATVVGYYSNGTKVTILETKKVGSTTWGRTDKGWISMGYVTVTGGSLDTQEPAVKTSTVKTSGDKLRIRKSASTSATVVGYYNNGAKVTILETKKVGSTTWGRTDKGWISMTYVK